ncbi:MAG: ester cyclase [Marmoricola sp.]
MAEMTLDEVKAVALRYFEELTNKRDVGVVEQLFTDDIAFYDPALVPDGEAHGHAEVRQFFSVFFKVFPDLEFRIDDFFAEGEKVAIRFTWTGTHRTEFLGIELKERHVAVPGIDIFHVRDGKIAEVRVAFDRGHLLQQLGGIHHPF